MESSSSQHTGCSERQATLRKAFEDVKSLHAQISEHPNAKILTKIVKIVSDHQLKERFLKFVDPDGRSEDRDDSTIMQRMAICAYCMLEVLLSDPRALASMLGKMVFRLERLNDISARLVPYGGNHGALYLNLYGLYASDAASSIGTVPLHLGKVTIVPSLISRIYAYFETSKAMLLAFQDWRDTSRVLKRFREDDGSIIRVVSIQLKAHLRQVPSGQAQDILGRVMIALEVFGAKDDVINHIKTFTTQPRREVESATTSDKVISNDYKGGLAKILKAPDLRQEQEASHKARRTRGNRSKQAAATGTSISPRDPKGVPIGQPLLPSDEKEIDEYAATNSQNLEEVKSDQSNDLYDKAFEEYDSEGTDGVTLFGLEI